MTVLVEGPRDVGKTYLIEKSKFDSYKFPFIPYMKAMIAKTPEDTGSGSKEAFHFSAAFDVTLLSMIKDEAIDPSFLIVDRSFLSNVVLGELQGRITHEDGLKYIDFLAENGYLSHARMIYVDKSSPEAGRTHSKDDWDFLGYQEQRVKYEQYFKYLKEQYMWEPVRFINNMTDSDPVLFDELIVDMFKNKSKTEIKSLLGKFLNKDFLDKIF